MSSISKTSKYCCTCQYFGGKALFSMHTNLVELLLSFFMQKVDTYDSWNWHLLLFLKKIVLSKIEKKKSLNPFVYKQSLRKLKGFSDFLKSGANDGTWTRDLRLTNLKIFLQKLVLYADKSLINTSKNASIFCNRCKKF